MDQLSTCDLYEASYYLLNHCTLEGIETTELNGKLSCRMIICGYDTGKLQNTYLSGQGEVNLFDFRRTYAHLTRVLAAAKKEYRKQRENQEAAR